MQTENSKRKISKTSENQSKMQNKQLKYYKKKKQKKQKINTKNVLTANYAQQQIKKHIITKYQQKSTQ